MHTHSSACPTLTYYPPGRAGMPMLNAIGGFRSEIWRERAMKMEHCADAGLWLEHADYDSHLWVVTEREGAIIATARMSVCSDLAHLPEKELYVGLEETLTLPLATLGRLAVAPEWRRKGVADQLIKARLAKADALGVRTLLLDCPEHRVGAMQKHGFRALKDPQAGILCPEMTFVVMGRFASSPMSHISHSISLVE